MTRRMQIPLLILAFILFYLAPLAFHGLWIPDETRYAQISQEMLLTGHWVTPHFMGLRYFEKPAAGYWMIAFSQAIFGQNLFGVRFASAASLGLSALLTWRVAGRLWRSRDLQVVCTVVFMSLALIVAGAGYANLDPQFTLWINLALTALWFAFDANDTRSRLSAWAMLGAACAMAFMTKGFLALVLPVLIALPFMLWQRRCAQLLRYGSLAVMVAALLALPWALAINRQEADFWNYFFWVEHIQRFAGNDAQHAAPWFYYLPVMIVASLPWIVLLPDTFIQAWKTRWQAQTGFVWLWLLLPLIFFSMAKGKLPSYILPCLLPLALLIGHGLHNRLAQGQLRLLRGNALFNLLLGVVGLLVLAYLQLKHPVYQSEPAKLGLLLAALLGWIVLNGVAVGWPKCAWMLPAAAMGLVFALVPASLPYNVVVNKTPDTFIAAHAAQLAASHSLLSNELSTAAALAWHTHNPTVTLYDIAGEATYGLNYPDAKARLVNKQNIGPWLAEARRSGSVGMALRVKDAGEHAELAVLPPASQRFDEGSIVILFYDQVVP